MNDIPETKSNARDQKTYVIPEPKQGKYIVTELRHGGHYTLDTSDRAKWLTTTQENVTSAAARQDVVEEMTEFNYLFADLARNPDKLLPAKDPASVVTALHALGDAMVEDPAPPEDPRQSIGNSTIPPVYTYWVSSSTTTSRPTPTGDRWSATLSMRDWRLLTPTMSSGI